MYFFKVLFIGLGLAALSSMDTTAPTSVDGFVKALHDSLKFSEREAFEKLLLTTEDLVPTIQQMDIREKKKEKLIQSFRKEFKKEKHSEVLLEQFDKIQEKFNKENRRGNFSIINYEGQTTASGIDNVQLIYLTIFFKYGGETVPIVLTIFEGPFGCKLYRDLETTLLN